jgi:spermidine/putrescine transport system permease protein
MNSIKMALPYRRPIRIPWLMIYSLIVILYLFFPIIIIALFSFNNSPAVSFPIRGFSLRWYVDVLGSPTFLSALKNTLIVAVITTIICVVIGLLAALAITRYKFRLKPLVRGLFIGLSLLSYFVSLNIHLSIATVVVGHLIYTLPYFFLVTTTRLERFDRLLEEAAQDLGCTPWQTFWKVNFPIIAPSIIGAALIVFALSFDEFLITFFVIGTESTLPMLVWSMLRRSIDPRVNAISVMLIISSMILLFFMSKVIDISEIEL